MKYFLILGNTRVGSTWLQTSFHALPRVFCIREIRWRMPYQSEDWSTHTYIDQSTQSIKERLDYGRDIAGVQNVVATGAKLKFDPYGFVPPSAFVELGRIIEDDVHLIMLRRSYFEIFETWKAFGIRHLTNPTFRQRRMQTGSPNENRFQREWEDSFISTHSEPPRFTKLQITYDQRTNRHDSPGAPKARHCSNDIVLYPIEDAINDLFVLFYNDIHMLHLLHGHSRTRILDYKDIAADFYSIARQVLTDVTLDECRAAIANSATRKLEPDGVQLVMPDTALRDLSERLNDVFFEIRAGALAVEDVVRYDGGRNVVEFSISGLRSVLERHDETRDLSKSLMRSGSRWRLFARDHKATDRWVAQRPVYLPAPRAEF